MGLSFKALRAECRLMIIQTPTPKTNGDYRLFGREYWSDVDRLRVGVLEDCVLLLGMKLDSRKANL